MPYKDPEKKRENDRECRARYVKKKRAENPRWEADRARSRYNRLERARNAKNRMSAIEKYGGKCSCCGVDEPEFLTFHHPGLDGKKDRALGRSSSSMTRRLLAEPVRNDIRLLCWNCHMAIHFAGDCPHKRHPESRPVGSGGRNLGTGGAEWARGV